MEIKPQDIENVKNYLEKYDGEEINLMEVCGSHTSAISKFGIAGLLSEKINLLSGPGCPVCVTVSAYIDKLISLSKEGYVIVTFGDLMRVPGSTMSLELAKGEGAEVIMVYSPMDILSIAKENPDRKYVFAAVGFETTTPVYALLMEMLIKEDIKNVSILTSLKTMPRVIENLLLDKETRIHGFLAPGHVAAVTGSKLFNPLCEKYNIPFVVAGFKAPELLGAIGGLVREVEAIREGNKAQVYNFYPSVVTEEGNVKAKELVNKYFSVSDAYWRGLGKITGSGMLLREEFLQFDAGSAELSEDNKLNAACRCAEVLSGKIKPYDCPLFGKVCNRLSPKGACMVSDEGSCNQYLTYSRR